MKFVITYVDAATRENKRLEIESAADVVGIEVPAQPDEGLPASKVDVNSDAVSVHGQHGSRLLHETFRDLWSNAVDDLRGEDGTAYAAANFNYDGLEREDCIRLLAAVSIQSNDAESDEVLREAVRSNVADGTIPFDDLPT